MSRSGRAGAGRGHGAPMSDADMAAMVAFTEQSQEDIDAGLVIPMDWLIDSNEEVVESSVSPPPVNVEVDPLMAASPATEPQPSTSSAGAQPQAAQPRFQRGSGPIEGIVSFAVLSNSNCPSFFSFFFPKNDQHGHETAFLVW